MKIRRGFVSNSSSSSFLIYLTKQMAQKFEKTFIQSQSLIEMTYDEYILITNADDLLNYFKLKFLEDTIVDDFILSNTELQFTPMETDMFNKLLSEYMETFNEQIDYHKEHLHSYSIETPNNKEDEKYLQESIEYFREATQFYEKLFLEHKLLQEAGPIKYIQSKECVELQNNFKDMLKILKNYNIIYVKYRGDGDAPQSDLENKLSKMSENQFIDFMQKQYNIIINNISKQD